MLGYWHSGVKRKEKTSKEERANPKKAWQARCHRPARNDLHDPITARHGWEMEVFTTTPPADQRAGLLYLRC